MPSLQALYIYNPAKPVDNSVIISVLNWQVSYLVQSESIQNSYQKWQRGPGLQMLDVKFACFNFSCNLIVLMFSARWSHC